MPDPSPGYDDQAEAAQPVSQDPSQLQPPPPPGAADQPGDSASVSEAARSHSHYASWARLGFGTAIIGFYCMVLTTMVPDSPGFDEFRKILATTFFVCSLIVFIFGRIRLRKDPVAEAEPSAFEPQASGWNKLDSGEAKEPTSVFSFLFWTIILLLLGISSLVALPWWLPPDAPQSQVPAIQAPGTQELTLPAEGRAAPRSSPEPLPPPVPKSPVRFKLQGIIIGKNERTAILDGKPFYEGDWIGDTRIIAITRDGVSVSNAAGTNILTVK